MDHRRPKGPQRFFELHEVARSLGVTTAMVRKWVLRGWLRARRRFWDWRVDRNRFVLVIRAKTLKNAIATDPGIRADLWNVRKREAEALGARAPEPERSGVPAEKKGGKG